MYAVRDERMPRRPVGPLDALPTAIRQTLAYADIFHYPLAVHELHRYLHGIRTSRAGLRAALVAGGEDVAADGGYYAPAGRSGLAARRRSGRQASDALGARARCYALLLKHLPYVRMVGITGSLAMRNAEQGADIDLMIVTAPGRVWLCRAAVVALVRLVSLGGDVLCPNYLVALDCLALGDITIYDAHELAQMVPLYGRDAYHRLWSANPEVQALLPNATPRRMPHDRLLPGVGTLKAAAECLLRGAIGDTLEKWERRRKSARLRIRGGYSGESILSPEQCKGHFGAHRARILVGYARNMAALEAEPEVDAHTGSRRGEPRAPRIIAALANGSERR